MLVGVGLDYLVKIVKLCSQYYKKVIGWEVLFIILFFLPFLLSYYFWGIGLVLGAPGTGLVPGYVSEENALFIMYSTMILFVVRWVCLRYFPTRIGTFYIVMGLWFIVAFYRWYTIAQVGIQISNMLGLFWLLVLLFLFVRGVFKHYETKNVVNKSPSAVVVASLFEEILIDIAAVAKTFIFLELHVRDKRPKISLFLHENLGFDLWSVGLSMYCIQSFIFFGSCSFWLLLFLWVFAFCSWGYAGERNEFLPAYMLTDAWFLKKFDEYRKSLCEERGIVFFRSSEIVQSPDGIGPAGGGNVGNIGGNNAGGNNNAGGGNNAGRARYRILRTVAHFSRQVSVYGPLLGFIGASFTFGVMWQNHLLVERQTLATEEIAHEYKKSVKSTEIHQAQIVDEYRKTKEMVRQTMRSYATNKTSSNLQLLEELSDYQGSVSSTEPAAGLPLMFSAANPPIIIDMNSNDSEPEEYPSKSSDSKSKFKVKNFKK